MGLRKGMTNNPYGRPPNERAITNIVQANLTGMLKIGRNEIEVKTAFAKIITDLLLFGKTEMPKFPGDKHTKVLELEGEGYIDLVKWWLVHSEGSVKPDINMYLNYVNNQIDFSKISDNDFKKIGEIIEPALISTNSTAGG